MNIELKITLWALACAYAIGNSFVYSWVFWSAFEINILQFASFTDILPSILYTIAIPCVVVIVGLMAADFWEKFNRKVISVLENIINSRITYYNDIKDKFTNIILTIAGVVILIKLIVFYKTEEGSLFIQAFPWGELPKLTFPFIIAIVFFYLLIKKTKFLNELKLARTLAIVIICLIPVACYMWGYINSTKIINGKDTFLVESDEQCKSSQDTKYRYISSISDKVFAISLTDGTICIFKYNSLKLTPEKNIVNLKPMATSSA